MTDRAVRGHSFSWLALTPLLLLGAACAAEGRSARPQLKAVFFFTPGCRMCKPTKDAVRKAQARFGKRISFEWVDLSDRQSGSASAARLFKMLDRYGVKKTPELAVFVGGTCVAGGDEIIAKLEQAVVAELAAPSSIPGQKAVSVNRMGVWAVSAAALADGVNPCAFAAVVLLVSMMAAAGRKRREVIVIGGSFVLAVFLTYFAIGALLYGVLQRLTAFATVSDLIFYAAFGLCIVCGLLSVVDAVRMAGGAAPEKMLLRLPEGLKTRLQLRLSKGVHARGSLFVAAFGTGVIVSLLESACTGQVYFPVIAGLVRESGTRLRGFAMLAWYNLLFILPLVAVLACAAAGVGSERLAKAARKRLPLVKLLLAAVFFLMAAWMFPALVWPPGTR